MCCSAVFFFLLCSGVSNEGYVYAQFKPCVVWGAFAGSAFCWYLIETFPDASLPDMISNLNNIIGGLSVGPKTTHMSVGWYSAPFWLVEETAMCHARQVPDCKNKMHDIGLILSGKNNILRFCIKTRFENDSDFIFLTFIFIIFVQ